MNTANSPSGEPLVFLRYRRREHSFPAGRYVIGRSRSCNLVVDSNHVSRQHAQLEVGESGALVSDLVSSNGVWVNGRRIEEPTWLRAGDRLVIGQEEIEVFAVGARPLSQKLQSLRAVEPQFLQKEDDDDEAPAGSERSAPGTRRSEFFSLVGNIVERALEEERTADAETMLQAQLTKILLDARARRPLDPDTREGALRYALLLAEKLEAPRWLDYALDLMTALGWVPEPPLSRKLELLMDGLEGVDSARLPAYVAALESIADPRERVRVVGWARGLGRASSRRGR